MKKRIISRKAAGKCLGEKRIIPGIQAASMLKIVSVGTSKVIINDEPIRRAYDKKVIPAYRKNN